MSGVDLYTIGYEGHTPEDFVQALRGCSIDRLVDVRARAQSRKPGFSKTKLGKALEAAEIAYSHEPKLGNPYKYREMYKTGDVAGGAKAYRTHLLRTAVVPLAHLAESVREERVCLMCLEHDHLRCHRRVIAEELARLVPGLRVIDL